MTTVFFTSCEQCYECKITTYKRDAEFYSWKKSYEEEITHCGVDSEFIKRYEKDQTYEISTNSKQTCSCRHKN